MRMVEVKIKNARPAVCPIDKKNCVGCPYNLAVGLLARAKAPYVVCDYEKKEEEDE